MQASAPPFAGAAPPMTFTEARLQKLRVLAQRFEIRPDFVARLRALEGFTIVMICDDSGSMNTPVDAAPGASPFAARATRWSELCETVGVVCELATALSDRGVDVHFLNRPPMLGVTQAQQLQVAFTHAPPQGFTPLTRALRHVLELSREALRERKLLVMIATDGQPTDDGGNVDIPSFLSLLLSKPARCYVQIMACTDDAESVAYLNEADRDIERLDVSDDFRSERKEVQRAQASYCGRLARAHARARARARACSSVLVARLRTFYKLALAPHARSSDRTPQRNSQLAGLELRLQLRRLRRQGAARVHRPLLRQPRPEQQRGMLRSSVNRRCKSCYAAPAVGSRKLCLLL